MVLYTLFTNLLSLECVFFFFPFSYGTEHPRPILFMSLIEMRFSTFQPFFVPIILVFFSPPCVPLCSLFLCFYSYEACFKGEIVFTGYGRQIIPQQEDCAINENNFTYLPDPTISCQR